MGTFGTSMSVNLLYSHSQKMSKTVEVQVYSPLTFEAQVIDAQVYSPVTFEDPLQVFDVHLRPLQGHALSCQCVMVDLLPDFDMSVGGGGDHHSLRAVTQGDVTHAVLVAGDWADGVDLPLRVWRGNRISGELLLLDDL